MTSTRENMVNTARKVILGEIAGDLEAAQIAIVAATFAETRDLILQQTTSDEQLNAEIVAEIKARRSARQSV